jgi:putative transcription antitermination factor YqgF
VRRGVRIGVDVGTARVGIARSDPDGLLAVPVATAPADRAIEVVADLVVEYEAIEVIVGLPVALSGSETASTRSAREFARELAGIVSCPIRLVDERWSTTQAQGQLRQTGRSGKSQRAVIDQAAAVIVVQHALDAERLQGVPPGDLIDFSSPTP